MNHVACPVLNAVSLCAGVGMLDEGARAAFGHLGIDLRTVAYGEWEAPAASQLVALMEAGLLDAAPVWCGDFRRINAAGLRGKVDAVVAGFPCQDLSVAGRRAGLNGKRSGLFFSVVDFADACGAWLLVLENVGGIASATASVVDEEEGDLEERAAARVLGELADRGWNTEWLTLSASDVGASHGRERWFCLAWRAGVSLADAARNGRDGSLWQAGSGRGVCEAGGELGDAQPEGRRPAPCAHQAGQQGVGEQGGARRCECGWATVRRPEFVCCCVADSDGDHGRGEQQPGSTWCRRGEPAGVGEPMAHPAIERRPEGRPESGRIEGRPDAAECGCAVADASDIRCGEPGHAGAVHRAQEADAGHGRDDYRTEPLGAAVADSECGGVRGEVSPADPGRHAQAQRPADQYGGCCGACVPLANANGYGLRAGWQREGWAPHAEQGRDDVADAGRTRPQERAGGG